MNEEEKVLQLCSSAVLQFVRRISGIIVFEGMNKIDLQSCSLAVSRVSPFSNLQIFKSSN
jgi:hypothetical protein